MKDLLSKAIELQGPVDDEQVKDLINFFDEYQSLPAIKTIEVVLKHYKDQLKTILTKDLLEWMQENDQQSFETDDVKVSIRTFVSAKLLDMETAFHWLQSNQYGDMIKDTMEFPKGELTPEAEAAIDQMGLSYVKKSGIHPKTLKKIMSDRLKDGEDLPDEEVGIKVGYFDECVVKQK